jgi:isopenicillin N synthase-like dioxygenase
VARYSMPFFLHFAPYYVIAPLPGCDRTKTQPPITAYDYLQERLREIRLVVG